jgi:hypothetical protein
MCEGRKEVCEGRKKVIEGWKREACEERKEGSS